MSSTPPTVSIHPTAAAAGRTGAAADAGATAGVATAGVATRFGAAPVRPTARSKRLPVHPVIASAVIAQLGAVEGAGLDDLTPWVELDPALTAAVIAAANLPHLHHVGRVGSIPQALVVLGSQMVEAIATGRVATLVMGPDDPGNPPRHWTRSISTAAASRVVARHLGTNPDDAYAAGMLHHVGDVVLFRTSPEAHARSSTARNGEDAELREYGRTHTEVGAAVLRDWFLPERTWRAVREHHCAPEALNGTLGRAVWAGARVASAVAGLPALDATGPARALRIVGVEAAAERIIEEIEREIRLSSDRLEGVIRAARSHGAPP
jgi:putative nucleotidyltransferase with HDIG domain